MVVPQKSIIVDSVIIAECQLKRILKKHLYSIKLHQMELNLDPQNIILSQPSIDINCKDI